jgi:phosphoribosylaminoimidazole-succinocarboxamide synthase
MLRQYEINEEKIKQIIEKYENIYSLKLIKNTTKIMTDKNNCNILIKYGKVRDIYNYNDNLLLFASDRLSAFNRDITTIPLKGSILNKVSVWWFNKTKSFIPNHIINVIDDRSIEVKKCSVFPIEFVMRSYLTGSTETSIWKNYEKGSRKYCGHILQDGMRKNQKLENIILTPTTKSERDELISENEILEKKIMTLEEWETCKKYSFLLFKYGQKICSENGLILVDTKYEFGKDENGNILLVDEIHTPDSSRFWFEHSYIKQFTSNKEPESIDKEFIRKWIVENYENPYNMNTSIEVSNELRNKLAFKYITLYELITGNQININFYNNNIDISF